KRPFSSDCLFEDVVKEQLRPAVVATVWALVVQAPVVGKVFDVVFAARSKVTNRFRRIAAKNRRDAAGLIEILFKPFEDARNLHLLLVWRKLVEVLAREPCTKCVVVLLFKFIGSIGKMLEWRATAGRADQHRMRPINDQRPH